MDLLLDTHVFIWFLNGDEQLSTRVRNLIKTYWSKIVGKIGYNCYW